MLLAGVAVRAVIVLSAHWYSARGYIGVGASNFPETIHDHPSQHLYNFHYPARGDPILADEVAQHLQDAGFDTRFEKNRGLDHGAWIALELLFPGARLPVIPVALPYLADMKANVGDI